MRLIPGGSIWIGRKTLLERLMTAALPEGHQIASAKWKRSSLVAAVFYLVLGGVNLWVAYNMSEKDWVFFKTWLTIPVVFVFTGGLMFYILRDYQPQDGPEERS